MEEPTLNCPIERLLTSLDADRVDDLGFLDPSKTPKLNRFDMVLRQSLTWIVGPPWLGKSKVADDAFRWLRTDPTAIPGLENRITLTRFGLPGIEREVPPTWWDEWCLTKCPGPAVWLLDGVDEGIDRNSHLFDLVLSAIDHASDQHLLSLRLILFSRPYAEMGDFEKSLEARFVSAGNSSICWLARLDRSAAEKMIGADEFPAICDLIRQNSLQAVAGYPIVLNFLKKYGKETGLSISQIWRGVLTALLGERSSNPRVRFETTPEDRFNAACRLASLLALTRKDTIRRFSLSPTEPTLGMLFERPDNLRSKAAQEAVLTAAFVMLPEQGAYRFTQRNVQDWFVAFAFNALPPHSMQSALAGDDGTILPRLRESARLLHSITSAPATKSLIDRLFGGVMLPTDALEPTLISVCTCLDKLEELATNSPWGLRGYHNWDDDLVRLKVHGLGRVLATRLRDTCRSNRAKQFIIEVVEATKEFDAIDAVAEIAQDSAQDGDLRISAMYLVTRFGGDAHLNQLEIPIGQGNSTAEIDSQLRGALIFELLKRGLWPIWRSAVYAPAQSRRILDSRALLAHRLSESITLDDAKHLLPHLGDLYERHSNTDVSHRGVSFVDRVIELTADAGSPDDINLLIRFALDFLNPPREEWRVANGIARRLRNHPHARHVFYEHDINIERLGNSNQTIGAKWLMIPDDWCWLRDKALSDWIGHLQVWEDAYSMARQTRDQGRITSTDWDAFVSLVEQQAPGVPVRFEDNVLRHVQEEQRSEAERLSLEGQEPSNKPLADLLNEVFARQELSDADRMRQVAWMCFSSRLGIDNQAVEGWDDLPNGLRNRVLDTCRVGLSVGEPTPIPQQDFFPIAILSEAAAFFHVSFSSNSSAWLDGQMIHRWLPTALYGLMSVGWTELIRTCWSISPVETEGGLLGTIVAQVRMHAEPSSLRQIPSECWTDSMTEQMLSCISNEEFSSRGRRELLEQLADRGVPQSRRIAAEWSAISVQEGEFDQLRQGGRNVLLRSDPADVLAMIEREFESRGIAALEELSVFWGWRDEFHVHWRQWAPELLERLGKLLLKVYPMLDDPEPRSGFVTTDQELRQVRDGLIDELLNRATLEGDAAIDSLAKNDRGLKERVDTRRASEKAGALLKQTDPANPRAPGGLSLEEAIKLLDRSDYRVIRSEDDLLDAVLDALTQISSDVGHDLPMLFSAPDRSGKQQPRKHLEEDSLQSYLRRRLLDRLPHIVDGVTINIFREDQVSRRQRFDLRIVAPSRIDRRSIQLVIEVKWSDNVDTKTSLVDQLGERYLRGEQLSHGVFLVGWCGEWSPGDGSGPNTDIDHLRTHLTSQRDDYCRAGEPGNGLRIELAVLDFRWSTR